MRSTIKYSRSAKAPAWSQPRTCQVPPETSPGKPRWVGYKDQSYKNDSVFFGAVNPVEAYFIFGGEWIWPDG